MDCISTISTQKLAIRATVALLLALGVSACAGSQPVPETVIDLGPSRGERLAAALSQTLDAHEAEILTAAGEWYPSSAQAYGVAVRYIDADLSSVLRDKLALQGLTMADLNQFAEENPEWVAEQNRIHRERMETIRPHAFAIMGRIDPQAADPLPLPEIPVLEANTAVADVR